MTPEQVKEVIQLQKEIDELERIGSRGIRVLVKHILSGKCVEYRSSWFSREHEIPSFLQYRIRGLISDEIEAKKSCLQIWGRNNVFNRSHLLYSRILSLLGCSCRCKCGRRK